MKGNRAKATGDQWVARFDFLAFSFCFYLSLSASGGYPGEARSTLLEVPSTRRMGVDVGAGDETMTRYPRERDSLAVRPFAGMRARLGTIAVPTLANDSTPPQATPAGEPSPGDFITNVSARRGEVGGYVLCALPGRVPQSPHRGRQHRDTP